MKNLVIEGRLQAIENKLEMHSKLLIEIKNIVMKSNHSISPKEVSSVKVKNINDPRIKIKKLEAGRQKTKEELQHNSFEEDKLPRKEGVEKELLEAYDITRNGRDVLDSKINEIFTSERCSSTKKCVVEPIDVSISSGKEEINNKKHLIKILESLEKSRNIELKKFNSNINEVQKKTINHSCLEAYSSLNNANTERKRPRIKLIKKGNKGNKGRKHINGIKTIQLNQLPGNCLELLCEFLGNKAQILSLSKKILEVYSQCRLQGIARQITFKEQTKYNCSDSSSSEYELVRFYYHNKEKIFVLSEKSRKYFNKIRMEDWEKTRKMICEERISERDLIILKLFFGLMGMQWVYFDDFIDKCKSFLQVDINSNFRIIRVVIMDPVEMFNFERENVERLGKLMFIINPTLLNLPPKKIITFFDILAVVVTEGLLFARLIDVNTIVDQELENLRKEKEILENYLRLTQA